MTSYCRDTVAVCIYVGSLKRTALAVVGCQYGIAHAFLTPPPRNVFFLTTLTQSLFKGNGLRRENGSLDLILLWRCSFLLSFVAVYEQFV